MISRLSAGHRCIISHMAVRRPASFLEHAGFQRLLGRHLHQPVELRRHLVRLLAILFPISPLQS